MTLDELIAALEAEREAYGDGKIVVGVDITPPAEPNEITGLHHKYHTEDGHAIVSLTIGWRIP